MKTLAINNNSLKTNNQIAFKGHNIYTTNTGSTRHKFFLPYDQNNFTAVLELRKFTEKDGEWVPVKDDSIVSTPLPVEGLYAKNAMLFPEEGVITGYRYVLSPKSDPSKKIYQVDSGTVSNVTSDKADEHFTLLFPNRNVLPENGLTKQVMPDICFPGYYLNKYGELKFNREERARALNAVRNHGNKLGGQFAGIIRMLPVWQREGYTKIVGTPFTKDEVSSHLYWTENPFQLASGLGDMNDFRQLQVELFKNGINFVADGAFVNQGLQGVLFRNLLRHGENSPFLHWFKASGILSGDFKLGAIPQRAKARENFRFRFVNAPKIVKETNGVVSFVKNPDYDFKKPTFVQLYDKRLVSQKQLEETDGLLKRYEITNTENPYEITNHDDVTQLLSFEVDATELNDNIKKASHGLRESEKTFANTGFIESILSFENFRITTKDKGGVDLWDGNMDIAKLNFYLGNTDQAVLDRYEYSTEDKNAQTQKMKRAIYQVQDYTLQAGKYWTKLVSDTQFEYIARTLNGVKRDKVGAYQAKIREEIEKGNLPAKLKDLITDETISHALRRKYVLDRKSIATKKMEAKGFIREFVMDFPLDSIELGSDITGVIASPYISKRANNEQDLLKSRRELFRESLAEKPQEKEKTEFSAVYEQADNMLAKEMTDYVLDVLENIQERLGDENKALFKEVDKHTYVTEYGRYVIPLLIPEIIKFGIVKGLKPSTQIDMDPTTGRISYKNSDTEDISLRSLGIYGTPEAEARRVINAIKKGIVYNTSGDGAEKRRLLDATLAARFKNVKLHQFKVAEAIMDQMGTGLGWRIDAAKDIGNIDALRTHNDDDERLLNQVTEFWKKFNSVVRTQNKHAYTTAEITDLGQIMTTQNGELKNEINAESKFIERSGLNNTANYMFFYSLPKELFSMSAENGNSNDFNNIKNLRDKLIKGWDNKCHGFLYQYPQDSIANSYTFVGNHDKPRVLHTFALDMELFHSDLSDEDHKDIARKVLLLNSNSELNPNTVSAKAIAMGDRLIKAFEETGIINRDDISSPIRIAISQLAGGIYKGESFDADAFGTRDFRHAIKDVLDIAEFITGQKIAKRNEYFDKVLENVLTPAMDKMETVYKMLVTLPGSPTDFVGDKEGSSGYETKSNNDYQQNRNVVPFEWVNATLKDRYIDTRKGNKPFVNEYYQRMSEIGRLRSRKELSALKNGETVSLPIQKGVAVKDGKTINPNVDVAAIFRYNDKGSQVICLYTTDGATLECDRKMNRHMINLEKISLGNQSKNWKEGFKAGLKEGDIFKNANNDATYKVCIENGEYVLRRTNSVYTAISIMPEDKNTAVLYKVDPQEYSPILATHYFEGLV